MYFDDSQTEVKVTDATHCDLETKSILKPPKARAPLQEVDLGNHITTVEFDVIRKRRVSFAGVNKIKEFNSEAKSFSICSTPAYEERVSTSSDSSAFSSSVSGTINSLTKENDLTILDDTMDLTDLSIVQQSAMDITAVKPQKPLQGVPDIFATRSQDSALFSQQFINRPSDRPVLPYEISNPSIKFGFDTVPLQPKSEEMGKPEEIPLVPDPRKMLLNELLEESAVDFPVDNYLKANVLFAQNNYNVRESICRTSEIKKPLLDVSEMDFTQALAQPAIGAGSLENQVQPVEKKDLDTDQYHKKYASNLFGSLDIDSVQSSRHQDPKSSHNPMQSQLFPNFIIDESRTAKSNASLMEFTEALPSKNINLVHKNPTASDSIEHKLLASSNVFQVENQKTMQDRIITISNNNESRPENINASLMEFTEALPSKHLHEEHKNVISDPYEIQNCMIPIFNIDESRSTKNYNTSQMEFTEALPAKTPYLAQENIASGNYHGDNLTVKPTVSHVNHSEPSQSIMPNHMISNLNIDESRTSKTYNTSQMEFTEALPAKTSYLAQENIASGNYHGDNLTVKPTVSHVNHSEPSQSIMPNHIIPNLNIDESRTSKTYNTSQMEFTEALPAKTPYLAQENIASGNYHEDNSTVKPTISHVNHSEPSQSIMPNHMIPNLNIDESKTSKTNNASHMEFTEVLPSKNIAPRNLVAEIHTSTSVSHMEHPKSFHKSIQSHIPNFNINESGPGNNNASQMEFTEALPSKTPFLVHESAPRNYVEEKVIPKNNNVSQMEFTEVLPSRIPLVGHKNVSGISHVEPLESSQNTTKSSSIPNLHIEQPSSAKTNASQMELTEAIPRRNDNLSRNNIVTSCNIGDSLSDWPNSHLLPQKPSQNLIRNNMIPNLNTDESVRNNELQTEFMQTFPSRNNVVTSFYLKDKLQEKPNISHLMSVKPSEDQMKDDMISNLNIDISRLSKLNNVSQKEFIDSLPFQNIKPPHNYLVSINPSQNMMGNGTINQDASQMEFTEALPSNNRRNEVIGNLAENRLLGCSNVSPRVGHEINVNSDKFTPNYVLGSNFAVCTEQVSNGIARIAKKDIFPRSEANSVLENSCMEFTSALPSRNQPGKTVPSVVDNFTVKKEDNVRNELNVSNTMDITGIDRLNDTVGDMKENVNIGLYNTNKVTTQRAFDLHQNVSKDVSQMEFTEALPARNIQATHDPARQENLNCETVKNNVFYPSYNLQTSNMEFTEVLPMFKSKAPVNSKEVHEYMSPDLRDKIISPVQNLNDSCSMDVTDIENAPDHNIFKNLEGNPDIYDKSNDSSDIPKLEIKEKINNENDRNSPCLSGSHNYVAERKVLSEVQSDFSQLEFTEAVPIRNERNVKNMAPDIFGGKNAFVTKRKSIMVSSGNDSLDTSNMEFTEFLQKPLSQHLFSPLNQDKEIKQEREIQNEVLTNQALTTSLENKENFDKLHSEDLTKMKNVTPTIFEKQDKIYTGDNSNKHASYDSAAYNNEQIDKSHMEFTRKENDLEQDCKNFNLPSCENIFKNKIEDIFPVSKQLVTSSIDSTQMDFTEAVQPKILLKENITQGVIKKRSDSIVDSDVDINKIPDASQMEFTEAITMPKSQNGIKSVKNEDVRPIVENKLDTLVLTPDNQRNISSNDNKIEKLTASEKFEIRNSEDVRCGIVGDRIQKLESTCEDLQSKSSDERTIRNYSPKVNALGIQLVPPIHSHMELSNTVQLNKSPVTIQCNLKSPNESNHEESLNLNEVHLKNEPVSLTQNIDLASPMQVDQSAMTEGKVNSLRQIFENKSTTEKNEANIPRLSLINTPKGKQLLATPAKCINSYCSNKSDSIVVETLNADVTHKKTLVHFNTPPVRINKKRKTMAPLNPEESLLLQSSSSDLATPLDNVSTVLDVENASQRRGIFDDEKKSAYVPEKKKEEWNRLLKNDVFMKERSFHFVNPCKWKYKFRWPMALLLEIPDVEVSENTRKKSISLVSEISESDHISVFINNRMKKNLSLILSEKWLNSHCKTIKDLLFTLKFVEEEYNKLEPLISSMKYFYQEFPFDFNSDRIIFKIVNLRKEYCFEVKIDVSYGLVKGKNIDVINHVGQISKTKVQQLFDQLQPNTERFFLFWKKLMKIHEL